MSTARDELHRLAESLPDPVAEELAAVGRTLEQQASAGDVEEAIDPQEAEIVLETLRGSVDDPEFTAEQAKRYLEQQRRRGA